MAYPVALDFGPDGTLYVGDDQLGLLAIPGVGSEPAAPVTPTTPTTPGAAPATPVSGDPSFTG
jgi:hypothetical protein